MRRTGVLTPTQLACIPVLETLPRDPVLPPRAPAAARRDVPPGIARMLRHIHSPNRSTVCPPPPPAGATVVPRHNVRCATEIAPVERVSSMPKGIQGLLRWGSSPPHLSPVAHIMRWSPAVTSSWHTKRSSPMIDWSPACTSGDGEDDTQDSLQHTLLPVELAPVFAAAAAHYASLSPSLGCSPQGPRS